MTRVDWFRVIAELQRSGMDHAKIARKLDLARSTVWNWQNGVTEPSHSKGEMLLSIYRTVVKTTG